MGVDVAYTKVQSASSATGLVPAITTPNTAGAFTTATGNCAAGNPGRCAIASDEGSWSVRFRVHRDFYP